MGGEAGGDGAAGRVVVDNRWAGSVAGASGGGGQEGSGGEGFERRSSPAATPARGRSAAGRGHPCRSGQRGREERGGEREGEERVVLAGVASDERRETEGSGGDGGRREAEGGLHGTLSGDPSPRRILQSRNSQVRKISPEAEAD